MHSSPDVHGSEIEDGLLVCAGCSREIPGDGARCAHCGHEIEPEIVGEPAVEEPSGRSTLSSFSSVFSPRFFQVQALVFLVWCLICSFCSLTAFFVGAGRIPWFPRELDFIGVREAAEGRTRIPESTFGQSPLSTPMPEVVAPSYWTIEENADRMTEAEWLGYVGVIEGSWAKDWVGWIEDVRGKTFGGYELRVDMDSPEVIFSGRDVTFDITDEMAEQVEADQQVTFSGRIESVTNVWGRLQIRLGDVEWSAGE